MSLTRILTLRQFLNTNHFCNSIRIKFLSSLPKSDKKIKEIKNFVINSNKFESNVSDLKKSVLIYGNENSQFFRKLFILNVCQFFFWIYLANVGIAFTLNKHKKKDETQDKDRSLTNLLSQMRSDAKLLWTNHSTQVLLSLALLVCGQLSISLFTLFTIRSVRYIILSPGARNVRITTFSVTGSPNRYRNYDIPLEHVSAFQYRNSGGSYIPLKVKGKWFYFLVDSNGHFYKPSLFDQTVGVFRVLK